MNEPVSWGPPHADAARNRRLLPVTARDITDGQGTVQLTTDGLSPPTASAATTANSTTPRCF